MHKSKITRIAGVVFLLMCSLALSAQEASGGPTSEKARKAYNDAFEYLRKHMIASAIGSFKKADKQDGGHCLSCQHWIVKYGMEIGDWKSAEAAAQQLITEADGKQDQSSAHYQLGLVLLREGLQKRKDDLFRRAHEEFSNSLASAEIAPALFADGLALAHLNQDEAARARFQQFVKVSPENGLSRQRALRFISQPELARARMAPVFQVTTLEGKHVSMDDLQGKVVLLDFWATWCVPCRQALPHMRAIAKKFQGQPLVILSVSLDSDEEKWKDFVAKNGMTWLQYRDGGFTGPISTLFDVKAIPQTFTIDADGVLQDQHIGDSSIEGKLKKLIAQAEELPSGKSTGQ